MPTRHVERIETDAGWDAAVPIVRQLWSHEDEAFVRSWREEEDYRLFGMYESPDGADPHTPAATDSRAELVAVAGVSVQRVLHHARHAWIHDFVVDEPRRGEGLGAELLAWIEGWARERDCEYVALACRKGNDAAREFYAEEGLREWGRVMEWELE